MAVDWQLLETGPADAVHTVLLLPGGMCSARSYAELMAEPTLADMRLIAATLPGHAGTPPPDDYSIENYARLAAELADNVGADVVLGFSMGASVALEMVASGSFRGPVILLGIAMSAKDEPAFFRAIVRLGTVLGSLPASVLAKGAASMVKRIPVSAERQDELRDDLRRNVPSHMKHALHGYAEWLQRNERPAERLCEAGLPAWIVHADKGDGGLTDHERRTLEACPHAHVVTIRGHVFFMPNEIPDRIAEIVREAIGENGSRADQRSG